jgi:PAS domain S-box-containing protein
MKNAKRKQSNLRKRAEKKLAANPKRKTVSAINTLKLTHELQVHQIELEMQNDELQSAKMATEDSLIRFSDLYDFSPAGYVTLDETGTVKEANLTFALLIGADRSGLLARPFQSFVFSGDKDLFVTYFKRCIVSPAKTTLEIRIEKKDKSIFNAQIETIGFKNSGTSTQQYLLTVFDISERKRIEERLRQSEWRFRNLFTSMDEGFALCEVIYAGEAGHAIDFRFIEVNPAFSRLTGIPLERVTGRSVKELIPEIEPFWIETFGRIVENGRAERVENPMAALGKHFEVHAWRFESDRFAALFNDITARIEAERLIRIQSDNLAFANKELEAFSYSVSHDLRNPLNSIGACLSVINKDIGAMGNDSKEAIQHIVKTTRRMSDVITDLLALSSITRQDVHRETTNLGDLVEAFSTELKSFYPQRKIEFIIQPDCIADANTGLVRILIENLVRNAWKYTSKTNHAHIEFGKQNEDGKTTFFIKDNGVGFDMADIEIIFKPFKRLHTDKEFRGTGIGLTIVKSIVEVHGGRIWAKGEKDKGATFYFTLGMPGPME